MSTNIYTTRIGRKDAIDVTAKSAEGEAKFFAPSWDLVMGFKSGSLSTHEYTVRYHKQLDSIPRDVYDRLFLDKKEVRLACYCRAGYFCHRVLLAKYLEKLGYGIYLGEL